MAIILDRVPKSEAWFYQKSTSTLLPSHSLLQWCNQGPRNPNMPPKWYPVSSCFRLHCRCAKLSGFLQPPGSKSLLQRCHSAQASYLFQQDKFYDVSYDTGDKSVQCSRKPDAFKFWLMWKALGTRELEQRVDRALAMARYLAQEIKKREGFRLVMEPEYANVCFWYIPPSLRNLPDGPELWKQLHTVAPVVKERMMKKGSMMVGYQPHEDKVNFFRMIIISPKTGRQDMDFVLDEIHNLGKDL